MILPIEVKSKFYLKGFDEQLFPEIYKSNEKARLVIKEIFSYMLENECQYGILSMYDHHHRFLRDLLIIQKSFGFQKPLQSKSPPVLKIYTYIACQLCKDFYSSQFLKLISESNIQSKSKRRRRNSFSDSLNSNKNLFSTSSHDQNFCFKYFKFKVILGRGSGKTLLCEYHEDTIALN
jgi:hypothetical protein